MVYFDARKPDANPPLIVLPGNPAPAELSAADKAMLDEIIPTLRRLTYVRAVLEGVAHRGADLIEAARADSGVDIHTVRIGGGMSANPTFAQALADAANCPIEVSPVAEATTIGAAFMAGLGVGVFDGMDDLDGLWRPAHVVEPVDPSSHEQRRERWANALERAGGWHADLSALEF